MKRQILTLVICFAAYAFSFGQSDSLFVTGLKSAKVYSQEQADDGSEYTYSDGRTFKINFFFFRGYLRFYAVNENNQRQELKTKFEVGYDTADGILDFKKTVKFLVGQYDFDGDRIDELVIAILDKHPFSDESDDGITVDVFKLENDQWIPIGILTGTGMDISTAEVYMNKITIQKHIRGFYYQWTFEDGRFKDTGTIKPHTLLNYIIYNISNQ